MKHTTAGGAAVDVDLQYHPDGRVELIDPDAIAASRLYNDDLAPVAVGKRTWRTYHYAALWMGMSACIPTYMLSSGLIASGMNWWQAIVTILLGNSIVLIPILLNSHPGTKYGIPFPASRLWGGVSTHNASLPPAALIESACPSAGRERFKWPDAPICIDRRDSRESALPCNAWRQCRPVRPATG